MTKCKPHHVMVFLCLFLCMLLVVGFCLGGVLQPKRGYGWEMQTESFNNRLKQIKVTTQPNVLVFGACAAHFLGDCSPAYNLGFIGTYRREWLYLAQAHSRKEDKVIVCFTINDFFRYSQRFYRRDLLTAVGRRWIIVRNRIRDLLGLYSSWLVRTWADDLERMTLEEYRALKVAGLDTLCGVHTFKLYSFQVRGGFRTLEIDLEDFVRLHKARPNTVFVYQKTGPFYPLEEDGSKFVHNINTLIEKDRALQQRFMDLGLPLHVVDTADKSLYRDLAHHKPSAYESIKDQLSWEFSI